jgi:hypothetical protein
MDIKNEKKFKYSFFIYFVMSVLEEFLELSKKYYSQQEIVLFQKALTLAEQEKKVKRRFLF